MNIHSVHLLWLLLLLPLFIRLLWRRDKRLDRRFKRFAEARFRDFYLGDISPFYSNLKLFLLIIAFGFLVFALARPQWDYREKEVHNQGLDILFAVDISRSMEATDIQPNRLMRSILQISSFVDKLKGDRVGLISFAGAATLECPLTNDIEAFKMVLNSLDLEAAVRAGTEISRALTLAGRAFDAAASEGVLILISDGEDLSSSSFQIAQELAGKGIRIYTLGVGSEAGAFIRNPHTGELRLSKLDIHTLRRIATIGGGEFYHVTPSAQEIQLMLSHIYQSEKGESQSRHLNLYKEQYHYFVLVALLFIILESLILPLKRKAPTGEK
ncbi:MAG: VWA domain-containing protein [Candidatus Cloacimonadaceae bacterium]